MRKTIVFSSTRGWNVGDELIFKGIRRLTKSVFGDSINWVLSDRNPDLKTREGFIISNVFSKQKDFVCDAILLAGTPEWSGLACRNLFQLADSLKVPVFVIGVGCGVNLTALEKQVLTVQGRWFLCRDLNAFKLLSFVDAKVLPCPAIFADQPLQKTDKINRIGIILQLEGEGQHALGKMYSTQDFHNLIDALKQNYDVGIICHYIEEFNYWNKFCNGIDVYYSYDVNDFLAIYKKFDAFISTRLHGACLGLAQGKLSILINTSWRCILAQKSFGDLMPFCDIKDAKALLDKIDIVNYRKKLCSFTSATYQKYETILKDCPL